LTLEIDSINQGTSAQQYNVLQHKLQDGYRQHVSIVKRSSSGLRSREKTGKIKRKVPHYTGRTHYEPQNIRRRWHHSYRDRTTTTPQYYYL